MSLPLEGLRVLDLSRALAGPFCAMILADLGADVVKVEPSPDGEMVRGWGPHTPEGISVYYLSIHRNKRSVALDFRSPEGLALIRELAGRSDVLVENFKPGTTKKMGIDYASIGPSNPRLVYGSITGFGTSGPYGDWPAVDQIAQGMSGLMSLTGTVEPTRVGIPIGDVVAGMWLAMAINAALVQRAATGRGQLVETTLLGGLIGLMSVQGQRALTLGDVPGIAKNDHPVICPYGMFHASDGPFNLSVATEDMWPKLCGLLGLQALVSHPDYADNAARLRNRDALKAILEERFATNTVHHWTRALVKLGLPAGPIFDLGQVFSDPHVLGAGMIEEIEHPVLGPLKQLANPMRMASMEGRTVRRAPPALGQDSVQAMSDWGLDRAHIEALVSRGVVMQA